MDGLFANGLTDLGPCALAHDDSLPPLTCIQGSRPAQLRKEVRLQCPAKPGIYGMVAASGELIYVGKAKSLRARLLSYFRPDSRPAKATRIVRQTAALVWEVCHSEFAALHRELELIRRWRPRWNVQGQPLRGRLTFLCLGRRPAPYLFLAREPPRNSLAVHGPLPAGLRTQEAVRRLNDLFRLRDCPQVQEMIFPEQGHLFPLPLAAGCLRFEIGTCLGPCTGTCSQPSYRKEVQAARDLLAGRDRSPLTEVEREMRTAAQAQLYERAASLRDRLVSVQWLIHRLQQLRHAREKMSFVYPVEGWDRTTWWYFVHGGRTLAAMPAPRDQRGHQQARRKIDAIYRDKRLTLLLDSYEHVDSMMLVSSWFRRFPEERKKGFDPCRGK